MPLSQVALQTGAEAVARAGLCYAINYFNPAALTYNAVDMVVTFVAREALHKLNWFSVTRNEAAARTCGIAAGCLVTAACFGPVGIVTALALNAVGLGAQFLMNGNWQLPSFRRSRYESRYEDVLVRV